MCAVASPILRLLSLCIVALCLQYFTNCAEARVENVVISKEYRRSDLVVLVQIEQLEPVTHEGETCGIRYVGVVHEVFKRSFQFAGKKLIFGRNEGLTRGHNYLLFLTYIADPSKYYDTLRERFDLPEDSAKEREKAIELVRCNGTIPGLVYETRAAWEVTRSYIIVEGIRPAMPNTVRYSEPTPLQWFISRDDLFSYLHGLGTKR